VLQYPIFWALVALFTCDRLVWGAALLAVAWIARLLILQGIDMALAAHRARPVRRTPAWLLPVRDVLSVAEIIASFFGTEVVWRGRTLYAGIPQPARPLMPLQDTFAGESESIVIG
jgi:ceramide glucosyltransferase